MKVNNNKEEIKQKNQTLKHLNENELWDTYWLRKKYPERFKKDKNI